MKKKMVGILLLTAALCFGAVGCKKEVVDPQAVAATIDGQDISLGEANFLLRYQQAQMQTYYGSLLGAQGQNMFEVDMTGTGSTYGDTMKEGVMESLQQMYLLEAHAFEYGVSITEEEQQAIEEAAQKFVDSNDEKTLEAMSASKDVVARVLTLFTYNAKMQDAMVADVDTVVSDEEAAQKTIDYVFISTAGTETDEDGNTIDLTDEEKAEKKALADKVLAAAGSDLRAAGEAEELTVTKYSYGADDTVLQEDLKAAVDTLADGALTPVIETENGYYIGQMLSTFDEEATQTKKDSIVAERKSALFTEKYEAMKEASEFTVAEDVWNALNFDQTITIKTVAEEQTDTGSETEAAE